MARKLYHEVVYATAAPDAPRDPWGVVKEYESVVTAEPRYKTEAGARRRIERDRRAGVRFDRAQIVEGEEDDPESRCGEEQSVPAPDALPDR